VDGHVVILFVQERASLHELALLALDSTDSGWSPSDGPKQELAQFVVDLLTSKADMLADYFSLQMSSVSSSLCVTVLTASLFATQTSPVHGSARVSPSRPVDFMTRPVLLT